MKNLVLLTTALAGITIALTGCGGGGGSAGTAGGGATITSMGVTPSLGKFSPGTIVNIKKPNGDLISTGSILPSGAVTMSVGAYTGPVIVEVLGAAGVTYYDEGTDGPVAFGVGKMLRAALPYPMTTVGVSSLTNAAVAKLEAAGSLSAITATSIESANAKIAAVFGLPDILVVPTPVGSTADKLNLATPGDKYALVLAALAQSAGTGKNALDVANAIADDLKDDVLDGQNAGDPVANAPTPSTIAGKYQTAATAFADASSLLVVANQPLVVTPDVSSVVAQTNQGDINLTKAMIAELRTTLKSFGNSAKTGFVDTQATKASADINVHVAPQLSLVAENLAAINQTISMFKNAQSYTSGNTFGFVPGTANDVSGGTPALVRHSGNLMDVWYGVGGASNCWTDGIAGLNTTLVCMNASPNAATHNLFTGVATFHIIRTELTSTVANEYSYKLTPIDMEFTMSGGHTLTPGADVTPSGASDGEGDVVHTVVSGNISQLALTGTLPSSTSSTTVDTVALNAVRTTLAGADNYRYAFSGSVRAEKLTDRTKVVTMGLDSGTFVDINETNTRSFKAISAKLIGSVQTTGTKLVGSVELGGFVADASGSVENTPTSMTFMGSISDIASGGAGEFLTGKIVAATTGYASYNATLQPSSSNFYYSSVTFTGTIQAPSRPEMKVVMGSTRNTFNSNTATLSYTYGSKSITGTGTTYNDGTASTGTLSNQDGIGYNVATGKLSKNGAVVGTIVGGMVNYRDGVTESLQ